MIKAIDSAVKELMIADNVSEKIFCGTVIGKIAPALACDVDLFSGFFILFQNSHAVSVLRGCSRRHKPGCARSDHDDIFSHLYSSSIYMYDVKIKK